MHRLLGYFIEDLGVKGLEGIRALRRGGMGSCMILTLGSGLERAL